MGIEQQSWAWLAATLTGGLAGSVLTLLFGALRDWNRRPKLRLSFAEGAKGCVVNTPLQMKGPSSGEVIATGRQRVLRMLVENYGRTTAHKVCVSSTRLALTPIAGRPEELADEVLEFHLALVDRSIFDLPPGRTDG